MTAKQHVVVVGSGIVGASIAWHLTRDGAPPSLSLPRTSAV